MTLGDSLQKKIKGLKGLKNTLPILIGNEAKNFFQGSFRNQGFTDDDLQKWQRRKSRRNDKGRAILVDTGDLRNSIRVRIATFNKIVITSDLPYSAVHNYGKRAGRGKGFKMLQRQFMGKSVKLNGIIEKLIKKQINKVLQP